MKQAAFSRGTMLGMVLIGALTFVGMLFWLGNNGGPANNGGGHAGGRGLNGFAGLAAMLDADGLEVRRARSKAGLKGEGLLILTPPANAKGSEIEEIVSAHRTAGPTMVIAPKWAAAQIARNPNAKRGWTKIVGTAAPEWPGFRDDVSVGFGKRPARGWQGGGAKGRLPRDKQVLSGEGTGLVPLVTSGDGRVLAAFDEGKGDYPALHAFAGVSRKAQNAANENDAQIYPLILVFEPDLLDNWGLADQATGMIARKLVLAAAGGPDEPVTFDLTLNGLGAARNLLTLAFEPPFLAATLCLIMAMAAIGWRAFNRFGPAWQPEREIALGKTMLVRNSAGMVRRAGRLHLIARPYADAARERLMLVLGLPRGRASGETDAAIDQAQARRGIAGAQFSQFSSRLSAAKRTDDVVRMAADLQRIEKELTQ
jgi:hypothetical protein